MKKMKDSQSSREKLKQQFSHKGVNSITKGELTISKETNGISESGLNFEEQYELIRKLNLDLVTLSPVLSYEGGRLPDPAKVSWPDMGRWVRDTSLFTFAILDGAFELGMKLFGVEQFLIGIVRNPEGFQDFISNAETLNRELILQLVDEGIDGIILADDIAHQNGLFVRPDKLQDLFIPSLASQVTCARTRNLPVFFHSDGNYEPVLGDIIEAGFSGIQCIEKRAGMDIDEIRLKYGKDIFLWGHLEVDDIGKAQDTDELALLVNIIQKHAAAGNFILGTTSGIFSGTDIALLNKIYNSV